MLLGGRPLRTPEKNILPPADGGARRRGRQRVAGARGDAPAGVDAADPSGGDGGGARRRAAAGVVDAVVGYAGSDLLCYRADSPDELVICSGAPGSRSSIGRRSDGARLAVGAGVVPIEQPPAAIEGTAPGGRSGERPGAAALSCVVQASGSIVVGLAVLDGRIDAETAGATALLDEQYQAERWGIDAEAERRRRRNRRRHPRRRVFLVAGRPGQLPPSGRPARTRVAG